MLHDKRRPTPEAFEQETIKPGKCRGIIQKPESQEQNFLASWFLLKTGSSRSGANTRRRVGFGKNPTLASDSVSRMESRHRTSFPRGTRAGQNVATLRFPSVARVMQSCVSMCVDRCVRESYLSRRIISIRSSGWRSTCCRIPAAASGAPD